MSNNCDLLPSFWRDMWFDRSRAPFFPFLYRTGMEGKQVLLHFQAGKCTTILEVVCMHAWNNSILCLNFQFCKSKLKCVRKKSGRFSYWCHGKKYPYWSVSTDSISRSLMLPLLQCSIRELAIFVMSCQSDPAAASYRHAGIQVPVPGQCPTFRNTTFHLKKKKKRLRK